MAAQVIGYVGQISEPELKLHAFRGVKQGTVVGQEGLEYYYDRYLRGKPGVQRVEVNAAGLPGADALAPTPPTAGSASGDARPRPAAGGRKGAAGRDRTRAGGRQTGHRGGVRRDGPAQRPGAGDRLLPELRPEQVRQTADQGRIPALQGASSGGEAPGAVHRPRRQRHLSDRLDVQADHRDGGARRRRHHPERRRSARASASSVSTAAVLQRRATPTTARSGSSKR